MKLQQALLLLLLVFIQFSYGQTPALNKDVQISVLTVGPGNDFLSDNFGHSAFRVKNGPEDVVYGYGKYPFNDPNFILNFARGKLNYSMDKSDYKQFVYAYGPHYNRTVKEQVLNLDEQQKVKFYNYLVKNYKPENREYLYDFFFDNCATRMRDVTNGSINGKVVYNNPKNYKDQTFRTLIQNNLDYNTWGSLGIDLALGSIIDQVAPAYDHMFLPENIYNFFEVATVNNKPLVSNSKTIYKSKEKASSYILQIIFGPFMIISLLSILIIYSTYKNFKNDTLNRNLDIIIFSITGLFGVLMLLLWFATDHEMTAYNYNLLWAMPLNLIAIKSLLQKNLSLKFSKYMLFLILMLCLMTMHWIIGVQRFAPALFPLIIALFIRFAYVMTYTKKHLA